MVLDLNFKGFMAPVFTPFNRKTGEVDVSIIKSYAQHLLKSGVQGVLVNGTVGEGVCMSVAERKIVLEAWLEAAKKTSLHVMVQIGGPSLRDVQELAKHAEDNGVSSILCLCDLFHRPSNVHELTHYLTLVSLAAPKTPLLYYHIPSFTGVNLDMEDFLKAGSLKIPTLAGIKFTHNNLEEGSRCLRLNNGRFTVLLGNDQLIAAGFFEGFNSLIATTLNMFATLISEIHQTVNETTHVNLARSKQFRLTTIINTIIRYGKWVPAMKEAMYIITGLDFGEAREPQGRMTPEQIIQLRSDLSSLDLVN
ncbi:N-acetylneuraminate lyase-like [Macrosteles quadrilineatus]|uniref:N-acetylneuraminate lyase-like n=1 Tax=Macrosteles quadrilineatus TaxID=74068 RepID=UPI0023E2BA68|nr:N-acetylneuraminate lyase-like [Macrosteles quadrilineatus]